MHNRGAPKQRLLDPGLYDDVPGEVACFLRARLELARERGVPGESLIVDPGPDFSKTPAQTIAMLRGLEAVMRLDHPVLLAISRKDFIGALLRRPPRARLPGTLAAVDHGLAAGAHIFRVHDVAQTRAFIALRGRR
jgi:dihydropteroate synthase